MNKKTMWLVFNTLFISFLIIMGIQIIQVNLKKRQLEKEIAETQLKINEENKKKDQIKNDMKKYTEAEKLERIARDKLNMKKEGETTYKVIEK
ncbi:MAG: septum formation initiator family protein [Leptotrichiaceae bacterium]|jgi:cell division protein FtsL|nr:cell division protein FtsL [Leptotrichiaceae bacterium]MBP6167365.1 cell division protein FtsL [Leptotrichiaceae bacterium]MBP7025908.1 cell division protein FtsL [Leptotrichiaceae bacterium]MBP8636529.1 cell division protein FtsL [Leptotrichiaceae bacterium]MBP9538243.1 cell division protein FtsL [Leptotrichiaceae bacterium]